MLPSSAEVRSVSLIQLQGMTLSRLFETAGLIALPSDLFATTPVPPIVCRRARTSSDGLFILFRWSSMGRRCPLLRDVSISTRGRIALARDTGADFAWALLCSELNSLVGVLVPWVFDILASRLLALLLGDFGQVLSFGVVCRCFGRLGVLDSSVGISGTFDLRGARPEPRALCIRREIGTVVSRSTRSSSARSENFQSTESIDAVGFPSRPGA